jgi:DNA-directed RNA polymerase subunit RPC12/RpoP
MLIDVSSNDRNGLLDFTESSMASGTFFVRSCPTCGRKLEVRVELLGRQVECVHCGANFTAHERPSDAADDLRIEQILARAQRYIESVTPVDPTAAK